MEPASGRLFGWRAALLTQSETVESIFPLSRLTE